MKKPEEDLLKKRQQLKAQMEAEYQRRCEEFVKEYDALVARTRVTIIGVPETVPLGNGLFGTRVELKLAPVPEKNANGAS